MRQPTRLCSNCQCDRFIQVPASSSHLAQLRCERCDRFIRWISKPSKVVSLFGGDRGGDPA